MDPSGLEVAGPVLIGGGLRKVGAGVAAAAVDGPIPAGDVVGGPLIMSGLWDIAKGLLGVAAAMRASESATSSVSRTGPSCPPKDDQKKQNGKPFAIGFRSGGLLQQFALMHGAETYADYLPVPWQVTVFGKINNSQQLIYVNLKGPQGSKDFDFAETLRRQRNCPTKLTSTDREVLEIQKMYPNRRQNTYWYNGPNPLEPGFNER